MGKALQVCSVVWSKLLSCGRGGQWEVRFCVCPGHCGKIGDVIPSPAGSLIVSSPCRVGDGKRYLSLWILGFLVLNKFCIIFVIYIYYNHKSKYLV